MSPSVEYLARIAELEAELAERNKLNTLQIERLHSDLELERARVCRWKKDFCNCGKVCSYETECGRFDGRIFKYCQYCGGKVEVV